LGVAKETGARDSGGKPRDRGTGSRKYIGKEPDFKESKKSGLE